ncbi:ketopantoate reductase family protein [Tumebacillus permanentifrigoris]|uniref:2-dehydropantoate 2-reductase n=1 Tax=Tumebacillus permanentifrigoris TaxID=378543 RepID=A0A316D8T7_9BACL|nr:ketopantoate reductase family protein [Tumebacillus permanentifrigoris]PWK11619.1 ketopantoate reductase [Tumebacillus permanentifrigoris]
MKIAIVGAGAIGRLLAGMLVSGGHTPLLICRRAEQAAAFGQEGLQFFDLAGQEQRVEVKACTGRVPADVDAALLTVKSYDTRTAAQLLPRSMPVLSLQNGLGNGEILAAHLDPAQLAIGLTTHGATSEGNTKVFYKGAGQTVIGDWLPTSEKNSPAHWWAELFTSCGHAATVSPDIRTEVWKKAMVNIGINPFTALYNVRNGELLESPSLLRVMRLTVEEAERVASLGGVALENSMERVLDVCRHTAANTSSMLQDLHNGRPTEIESLCGVIEAVGKQQGIETPYNTMLLELVREAERRRTKKAP